MPPYDYGRLYNAASQMRFHLPGVPLSTATVAVATDAGFDVLDGSTHLATVTVKAGDEWDYYRNMWMAAVRDAPHNAMTRDADWLGISSLTDLPTTAPILCAGDPVGLRAVPGRPDLALTGATLVDETCGGWLVQPQRLSKVPEAPIAVPAQCVGALPNWPLLGISVACLRAFAGAHGEQLADATTEEVCNRVCKPLTEAPGRSLCTCIQHVRATDAEGRPFVGAPTAFVSHARAYRFSDLLASIEKYARKQPEPDEVYVWLDVFSQHQHWVGDVGSAARVVNWDVVFELTIAAIGSTCFVLSPWHAPLPLQRAWMLWEALATLEAKARLTVLVPPDEERLLERALVDDFESIYVAISSVNARQAVCFTPDDAAMIHAAIERSVGHSKLNQDMTGALRRWLADAGRSALARLPATVRGTSTLLRQYAKLLKLALGQLDEAAVLYREALDAHRTTLGDRDPETLALIGTMASLLQDQGKLSEAEPLKREVLSVQREMLGDRHPDTLVAINAMASLLQSQGKLDEAEPLYREALDARRATLGDRHKKTLRAIHDMAVLLQQRGQMDEAKQLYLEAFEGRRAVFGDRHPRTIDTMSDLAQLLKAQRKLDEAQPLMREALEARREMLGDRHHYTLTSINCMAVLLKDQGRLDEAEPLMHEALAGRRATLGNRHRHTLVSISSMAALLVAQGKLDQAEPLYREALEGRRATLGDEHPDTLVSIKDLARMQELKA